MFSGRLLSFVCSLAVIVLVSGCGAEGDNTGTEFAPNMYHPVPYEPLKQITEEPVDIWSSTWADNRGEFYNSNPYNPFNMNMRVPPENTVKRRDDGMLPYRIPADSFQLAARIVENPLDSTEAVLQEGQVMYNRFCLACHGGGGQGDGPVGQVYKGVPPLNTGRVADLSEGHIFHVITYGRGRMGDYGSQIDILDRWKIVEYVQTLQQQ